MRIREYLNRDWYFTTEYDEGLLEKGKDMIGLHKVTLPHSCVEMPFHYFDEHIYQMVSGYKRTVTVPKEWHGKTLLLTIDGAAHDSKVYWNGKLIGEHHCGYTAFTMDVTEEAVYGEDNELVIQVDSRENLNIPPFGFVVDYMTYGGIYRDVYLDVVNTTYLSDVFIYSEIKDVMKKKIVSTSVITWNTEVKEGCIRQYIRKKGETEYRFLNESAITGGTKIKLYSHPGNVELWDVDSPVLYEVKTQLLSCGDVVDEKTVVTGFRKAVFAKDGFYLNDRKVLIRGLNRHQSYPYVGYAMPKSMQVMDADILKKELKVNAVRTSHYPQSHYFLDRCDELGLLVFTELPGWQHIGNAEWKRQALENVKDMVEQYRNHTSIIIWGVRINESVDDDEFYLRTNEVAHLLDPSRPTGGVRAIKKSNLLEDVYTYNDFIHNGKNKGCEKKSDITSDVEKGYLITEYNGHMYPTKAYDWEEHRREHAIRHARVLNAVAGEPEVAGSFGWCMFDYNTHKDFGSGDRVCYHGVLDMFRNPKMAALIYAMQNDSEPILEISSTMDIGEHPATNRGDTYIFTNADSVKMYKNDRLIKEYKKEESAFTNLAHGPILIDDYIGDVLETVEHYPKKQAEDIKKILHAVAKYGMSDIPKNLYPKIVKLLTVNHMKFDTAVDLFTRYIGDWGGTSTVYRFDAIKDGEVVKTLIKEPMHSVYMELKADHTELVEDHSYDVAAVRICMTDEHGNVLPFFNEPVVLRTEGDIEIIGPKVISLQGGMGGTYVKTVGTVGAGTLYVTNSHSGEKNVSFEIRMTE